MLVENNKTYRITSNKRPGRLLNFSDYRRGVYSRGRLKEGGIYCETYNKQCAKILKKKLLKRQKKFPTLKLKFRKKDCIENFLAFIK